MSDTKVDITVASTIDFESEYIICIFEVPGFIEHIVYEMCMKDDGEIHLLPRGQGELIHIDPRNTNMVCDTLRYVFSNTNLYVSNCDIKSMTCENGDLYDEYFDICVQRSDISLNLSASLLGFKFD